ncbi:MAG: hypothetical protein C0608_04050 [Deltaproteobacteria bacterium]|nr:MAG: hypothetical protein C0608_04050 [Deltaproteobacteria bacterium]
MFEVGKMRVELKDTSPLWALFPVLAAVLFSITLLKAGLVWDDIIFESRQLPYFKTISDAFIAPDGVESLTSFYFRPVVLLSYMLDQWLASSDGFIPAAMAHGANVAYHVISTFLLYWLASLLFRGSTYRGLAALVATLIFALHPIHAETVMNISGRSDGLATMFFLAALVAAILWRDKGKWLAAIATIIFIFLSLLAKEIGISALFVIPVLLYFSPYGDCVPEKPLRRLLILMALICLAVALYFAIRMGFGFNLGAESSFSFGEKVIRLVGALGYYLRKSIFVWPQSHFMPNIPFSWGDIAALVITPVLLFFMLLKKEHRATGLICCAIFALGLAPSLLVAIKPLAATPVAERYLYLPSVGVCLLIGYFASRFWEIGSLRIATLVVVALLTAVYGYSYYERTQVWHSNLSFWQDIERNPQMANNRMFLNNLAEAYLTDGQRIKALTYYERMLTPQVQKTPFETEMIKYSIGIVHVEIAEEKYDENKYAEASAQLKEALPLLEGAAVRLPSTPIVHKGYALGLLLRGKISLSAERRLDENTLYQARKHCLIALSMDRESQLARDTLAEIDAILARYGATAR